MQRSTCRVIITHVGEFQSLLGSSPPFHPFHSAWIEGPRVTCTIPTLPADKAAISKHPVRPHYRHCFQSVSSSPWHSSMLTVTRGQCTGFELCTRAGKRQRESRRLRAAGSSENLRDVRRATLASARCHWGEKGAGKAFSLQGGRKAVHLRE